MLIRIFFEYHRQRRIERILRMMGGEYRQEPLSLRGKRGLSYFFLKAICAFLTLGFGGLLSTFLPPLVVAILILPALMLATDGADYIWHKLESPIARLKNMIALLTFILLVTLIGISKLAPLETQSFLESIQSSAREWHESINQSIDQRYDNLDAIKGAP